jgi:limonene-1,2-epoxide hydrolase
VSETVLSAEPRIEVIRRLQRAIAAEDKAAFLDFFAPEVEYHYHVGSRPLVGIAWVDKFISKYWADNSGASWVIERHAESDGHLFTEGREEYVNASGETVTHRYMGIIDFRDDGKIVGWRDYFQMADPNATH